MFYLCRQGIAVFSISITVSVKPVNIYPIEPKEKCLCFTTKAFYYFMDPITYLKYSTPFLKML